MCRSSTRNRSGSPATTSRSPASGSGTRVSRWPRSRATSCCPRATAKTAARSTSRRRAGTASTSPSAPRSNAFAYTARMYDYDWLVIGSGPAGEKGAVQAAYFGKRVAVVERQAKLGGACVNTGTLPSKTLRETALYLSGWRQREMYGMSCQLRQGVSVPELMCRQDPVLGTEGQRIHRNLDRHKVDLLEGDASFVDEHTVEIVPADGTPRKVTFDAALIATGSTPYRPPF